MFPIEILNYFISNNYQLLQSVKRYIVAAELHFYNLQSNTIEVFSSFKELGANYPANGQRQYINIRQNPVLKNVILEPSTNWDLTSTDSVSNYLSSRQFNLSFLFNGKRLYYNFNPGNGTTLALTTTTDKTIFEKAQAASKLQLVLNDFFAVAVANQQRLSSLSQQNLPAAQRDIVNRAIVDHNYMMNTFAGTMPKDVIISGQNFSAANVSGIGIGVIPVIVWIVAIIVGAGCLTYAVIEINNAITNALKYKATLQANATSVEQQLQAAKMLQNNEISPSSYNQILQTTNGNIAANNQQLNQLNKEQPGMLDKFQNILFIGLGGLILLKLVDKQ